MGNAISTRFRRLLIKRRLKKFARPDEDTEHPDGSNEPTNTTKEPTVLEIKKIAWKKEVATGTVSPRGVYFTSVGMRHLKWKFVFMCMWVVLLFGIIGIATNELNKHIANGDNLSTLLKGEIAARAVDNDESSTKIAALEEDLQILEDMGTRTPSVQQLYDEFDITSREGPQGYLRSLWRTEDRATDFTFLNRNVSGLANPAKFGDASLLGWEIYFDRIKNITSRASAWEQQGLTPSLHENNLIESMLWDTFMDILAIESSRKTSEAYLYEGSLWNPETGFARSVLEGKVLDGVEFLETGLHSDLEKLHLRLDGLREFVEGLIETADAGVDAGKPVSVAQAETVADFLTQAVDRSDELLLTPVLDKIANDTEECSVLMDPLTDAETGEITFREFVSWAGVECLEGLSCHSGVFCDFDKKINFTHISVFDNFEDGPDVDGDSTDADGETSSTDVANSEDDFFSTINFGGDTEPRIYLNATTFVNSTGIMNDESGEWIDGYLEEFCTRLGRKPCWDQGKRELEQSTFAAFVARDVAPTLQVLELYVREYIEKKARTSSSLRDATDGLNLFSYFISSQTMSFDLDLTSAKEIIYNEATSTLTTQKNRLNLIAEEITAADLEFPPGNVQPTSKLFDDYGEMRDHLHSSEQFALPDHAEEFISTVVSRQNAISVELPKKFGRMPRCPNLIHTDVLERERKEAEIEEFLDTLDADPSQEEEDLYDELVAELKALPFRSDYEPLAVAVDTTDYTSQMASTEACTRAGSMYVFGGGVFKPDLDWIVAKYAQPGYHFFQSLAGENLASFASFPEKRPVPAWVRTVENKSLTQGWGLYSLMQASDQGMYADVWSDTSAERHGRILSSASLKADFDVNFSISTSSLSSDTVLSNIQIDLGGTPPGFCIEDIECGNSRTGFQGLCLNGRCSCTGGYCFDSRGVCTIPGHLCGSDLSFEPLVSNAFVSNVTRSVLSLPGQASTEYIGYRGIAELKEKFQFFFPEGDLRAFHDWVMEVPSWASWRSIEEANDLWLLGLGSDLELWDAFIEERERLKALEQEILDLQQAAVDDLN